MVACEGRPTGMTLGLYLRVSPSSFDMFFQSERLTLLYIYFIWTAPLFALAFEGALLPLSMHEPALSPLLALPKRIAPRTEWLRDLPTFFIKSDAKIHTFIVIQQVKERYLTLFVREGLARRRGRPPDGGGVLCTHSSARSSSDSCQLRAEWGREFTEDRAPARMGNRGGTVAI